MLKLALNTFDPLVIKNADAKKVNDSLKVSVTPLEQLSLAEFREE